MMTDPIADLITRLRNGYLARKVEVSLPYSKVKHALADILAREGFVNEIQKGTDHRGFAELKIRLQYRAGRPAITLIDRVSKPGHRIYKEKTALRPVQSGYGISIITTSQGMMTGAQAKAKGIGGEVICHVA